MSSEIKLWWTDNKIDWYERAASFTDFHKRLAEKLSLIIPKGSSIIEIGCGLGYLAYELSNIGYNTLAYDIDNRIIERAKARTGLDIYHVADCYNLNQSANYVVALFFGRITDDDNYINLSKLANKELIYITGGKRRENIIPNREIEDFLESRNIEFEEDKLMLPFHQQLKDKNEVELYLNTYYKDKLLEEKRGKIIPSKLTEYEYILENNKELTIFRINSRRKTK